MVKIAVLPLWDQQKQSYWMLPGYMDMLEKAGVLCMMVPFTEDDEKIAEMAEFFDGFLFTGGHDLNPALYRQENRFVTEYSPDRDHLETKLYPLVKELDKPMLGICRGIQFFNVMEGGTLYQDLPAQKRGHIRHLQAHPYEKPVHNVTIIKDTPLYDCLHTETCRVNSIHHQGIRRLGDHLVAMAVADDGLIEAVYNPDARFAWAVQWHPEYLYQYDEQAEKIVRAFVDACLL